MVLGGPWSSPGAVLGAPELLWSTFWDARGGHTERFCLFFVSLGGARGENSENLDFDDPLDG